MKHQKGTLPVYLFWLQQFTGVIAGVFVGSARDNVTALGNTCACLKLGGDTPRTQATCFQLRHTIHSDSPTVLLSVRGLHTVERGVSQPHGCRVGIYGRNYDGVVDKMVDTRVDT